MNFHFRSGAPINGGRIAPLKSMDNNNSNDDNDNNSNKTNSINTETSVTSTTDNSANKNQSGSSPQRATGTLDHSQSTPTVINISDGSSKGYIRIHPNSQTILNKLFDSNATETSIPLRQRNLPPSFFKPTLNSNSITDGINGNRISFRSTSYDVIGGANQNSPSARQTQSSTTDSSGTNMMASLAPANATNIPNHHMHCNSVPVLTTNINNLTPSGISGSSGFSSMSRSSNHLSASCSNQSIHEIHSSLSSLNGSHTNLVSSNRQLNHSSSDPINQHQQQPKAINNQKPMSNSVMSNSNVGGSYGISQSNLDLGSWTHARYNSTPAFAQRAITQQHQQPMETSTNTFTINQPQPTNFQQQHHQQVQPQPPPIQPNQPYMQQQPSMQTSIPNHHRYSQSSTLHFNSSYSQLTTQNNVQSQAQPPRQQQLHNNTISTQQQFVSTPDLINQNNQVEQTSVINNNPTVFGTSSARSHNNHQGPCPVHTHSNSAFVPMVNNNPYPNLHQTSNSDVNILRPQAQAQTIVQQPQPQPQTRNHHLQQNSGLSPMAQQPNYQASSNQVFFNNNHVHQGNNSYNSMQTQQQQANLNLNPIHHQANQYSATVSSNGTNQTVYQASHESPQVPVGYQTATVNQDIYTNRDYPQDNGVVSMNAVDDWATNGTNTNYLKVEHRF